MTNESVSKLEWLARLRGADLTHAEFRVLVMLSTFAAADLTNAYPSNATLARAACVNAKVLTRDLLPSLASKGWIQLVSPVGTSTGAAAQTFGPSHLPSPTRGYLKYPLRLSTRVHLRYPLPNPKGVPHVPTRGYLKYPEGGTSRTPHQVIDQVINQGTCARTIPNAGNHPLRPRPAAAPNTSTTTSRRTATRAGKPAAHTRHGRPNVNGLNDRPSPTPRAHEPS